MFVTLAEGMDTLPTALAQALPAGTVRTSTAVRRISRNEPVSPWLVELLDGPPLEADAVIVATEAHAAARFLDAKTRRLALQLRAIPYASSLIVNVAYRRDQISHPLDGFGAVVPAIEGRLDPGGLVPERQVPQPGPGRNRPACAFSSAAPPIPSSSTSTMRRSPSWSNASWAT